MSASLFQRSLSSLHKDLQHLAVCDEGNLLESALSAKPVDDSYSAHAGAALLVAFGKKFVGESPFSRSVSERETTALKEFLRCNEKCSEKIVYDDNRVLIQAREVLRDFLQRTGLYMLSYSDLACRLTHGPGSSQGVRFSDFLRKSSFSVLTGTSSQVISLYRSLTSNCKFWNLAEAKRSENFGERVIEHNLLGFAPKSWERERVRMTENSANMAVQLAIGSVLWDGLISHFGIHYSDEPNLNRLMAMIGSKHNTDPRFRNYCTIDLTSASDLISSDFVRWFFDRTVLLDMMELCRSKSTKLPDGKLLGLNMWSTMGNGFTFPLQTLIFTCIIVATYRMLGIEDFDRKSKSRTYGVFGDDMVVVSRAFDTVCETLSATGFEVNSSKSYSTGDFRESCGTDWYRGDDVRGVYVKRLSCRAEVVSAINRLNAWSSRTGIPLPRTISTMLVVLGKNERNAVPLWADDTSGIKMPMCLAELSGSLPPVTSTARLAVGGMNGSAVYLSYDVKPKRLVVIDHKGALSERRDGSLWEGNIPGLILSSLAGYLRDGVMTLRSDVGSSPRFKTRLAVGPGWDYNKDEGRASQHDSGAGAFWKRTYFLNLSDLYTA